jgi:hypothetical protein
MTPSFLPKAFAVFLSAILFLPVLVHCQDKSPDCRQLHDGIYYYYPINSTNRYVCYRQGNLQREIDLTTGDSAIWQVSWEGFCAYSLKYISGNKKMPPETLKFLKKHTQVFRIEAVTEDYYVYTSFIDEISSMSVKKDTLWLHEKATLVNNAFFSYYPDETALQREHFSDTSRYAVLYLYRPGKFTNSLVNSLVYCNDNIMWVSRNNSGCLVKILKEGEIELKSKRYEDESAIKLNIQFGKKYYVKSLDHWNLSGGRLEMVAVDAAEGLPAFQQVKIR